MTFKKVLILFILMLALSVGVVYAEEPLDDEFDPDLLIAIKNIIGIELEEEIYQSDLDTLTTLSLSLYPDISTLNGLEYIQTLDNLHLDNTSVTDIRVIEQLPNLQRLSIQRVQLSPESVEMLLSLNREIEVQFWGNGLELSQMITLLNYSKNNLSVSYNDIFHSFRTNPDSIRVQYLEGTNLIYINLYLASNRTHLNEEFSDNVSFSQEGLRIDQIVETRELGQYTRIVAELNEPISYEGTVIEILDGAIIEEDPQGLYHSLWQVEEILIKHVNLNAPVVINDFELETEIRYETNYFEGELTEGIILDVSTLYLPYYIEDFTGIEKLYNLRTISITDNSAGYFPELPFEVFIYYLEDESDINLVSAVVNSFGDEITITFKESFPFENEQEILVLLNDFINMYRYNYYDFFSERDRSTHDEYTLELISYDVMNKTITLGLQPEIKQTDRVRLSMHIQGTEYTEVFLVVDNHSLVEDVKVFPTNNNQVMIYFPFTLANNDITGHTLFLGDNRIDLKFHPTLQDVLVVNLIEILELEEYEYNNTFLYEVTRANGSIENGYVIIDIHMLSLEINLIKIMLYSLAEKIQVGEEYGESALLTEPLNIADLIIFLNAFNASSEAPFSKEHVRFFIQLIDSYNVQFPQEIYLPIPV